jgi:phosphohistidine phosphatase
MYIFIMRHGEAEPYRESDKSRQLTSFGATQAEHAAKWVFKQLKELSADNEILDTAFVSPYIRTQQTLEALKKSVSIADVQTQTMITPMGDAEDVQDYIDAYSQLQPSMQFMAIISHMPLVSLLADRLCVGFNARIFDTADTLLIDYDPLESKGKQVAFYQSLT